MKNENDFRKDLMQTFFDAGRWCKRIEPSRGMLPGIPDVVTLLNSYPWFVELKVGVFEDGFLWPREVRPAQIGWHREYNEAGGHSFICVGVELKTGWQVFCLWPDQISGYENGIRADKWFLVTTLHFGFVNELECALNGAEKWVELARPH